MTNEPYVKQYNAEGELLNPITKDKPYLNQFKSKRGQSGKVYVDFHHPLTGRWMGRIKKNGNNRKWNNGKPRGLRLN